MSTEMTTAPDAGLDVELLGRALRNVWSSATRILRPRRAQLRQPGRAAAPRAAFADRVTLARQLAATGAFSGEIVRQTRISHDALSLLLRHSASR
jgi:hypothetical protein